MNPFYTPDETFPFERLILTKPSLIGGGNYFIRFLLSNPSKNEFVYIQPPHCFTKQGIIKSQKKYHTDLVFTNENDTFIQWLERLENTCVEYIYQQRKTWFETGEVEKTDIENYMTSPIKLYKSGKQYLVRVSIASVGGKPTLKIYDESEEEVSIETITDKTEIITVLEIQGIKCSSRSFQIEIEMKQMMTLRPRDIFERCRIRPITTPPNNTPLLSMEEKIPIVEPLEIKEEKEVKEEVEKENPITLGYDNEPETETKQENNEMEEVYNFTEPATPEAEERNPLYENPDTFGLEEIDITLDNLEDLEKVEIKQRNDVYYQLYKDARKKAKMAHEIAITAYLEAKNIKNTHLLMENISDSEEEEGDDPLEQKIYDLEKTIKRKT